GMTRRLDPMDRIRELSDASVPFNFDVHALFFSEDAFGIEAMLHRHFADKRVNRINMRREFFYATPEEVLEALREHNVAVVEYRTEASVSVEMAGPGPAGQDGSGRADRRVTLEAIGPLLRCSSVELSTPRSAADTTRPTSVT